MDKDSKKIIEMIESGQADAYMIVASPKGSSNTEAVIIGSPVDDIFLVELAAKKG